MIKYSYTGANKKIFNIAIDIFYTTIHTMHIQTRCITFAIWSFFTVLNGLSHATRILCLSREELSRIFRTSVVTLLMNVRLTLICLRNVEIVEFVRGNFDDRLDEITWYSIDHVGEVGHVRDKTLLTFSG